MTTHPTVAAIIPAAGRSSRMGTPKALLEADGQTFLERVAGALGGGGCTPVLVVVEDLSSEVAEVGRTAGCIVLENPDPSEGPVSSLRVGIAALPARTAAFAVCPVDHPLLTPATVRLLLDDFRHHAAPITIPLHRGRRGHPTLFHRDLEAELLEPSLPEGARTVVLRHDHRVREVSVDDEGVAVDIDTPPEYHRHFPASYRRRFPVR